MKRQTPHLKLTLTVLTCAATLSLIACGSTPPPVDVPVDAPMDKGTQAVKSNTNPCNPDGLAKPPIWAALADLSCSDSGVKVQAAADVTKGSKGKLKADLDPITKPFEEVEGMCPVNVHWHLGAEHRNEGSFDIPGKEWLSANDPGYTADPKIEPGNFCQGFDKTDSKFTTPYDFKYCKDMKVGYTYEIHWPHSNLGMCGTEWQYQSHFMNGVLCKANQAKLSPGDAVESVFGTKSTKIGVQAQVFTIVNDAAYDYPNWKMLGGWNTSLAKDVAIYQGSTTGLQKGNEQCRASGGMVSWQVDRGCNLISAKAFDELCRVMKEQKVDMSSDTHAHNARMTTAPEITTDQDM